MTNIFMQQDCKKKSSRESQKQEEALLTQVEELWCQSEVDRGQKTEVQDSFEAWVHICDEVDALLEHQRLQEEDLRQCFEKHKETWEPTAKTQRL